MISENQWWQIGYIWSKKLMRSFQALAPIESKPVSDYMAAFLMHLRTERVALINVNWRASMVLKVHI